MHGRGMRFGLTVTDIAGMVPRFTRRLNRNMYLFHIYRTRETQDFGDRQMY